jgi:rhomboid protease GluP
MCPNCRAFITTDDRVCPYCDAAVGPRAIDLREPAFGGFFLTPLILTLCVGFYLVTVVASMKAGNESAVMGLDSPTLKRFGGKFTQFILAGQWWRVITAGFLHGGLMHIFMNSWGLLDLGRQVEMYYGVRRMIVIYVMSTIGGFALSTIWTPVLSIGASAGIFGLLGAMLAMTMRHEGPAAQYLRGAYTRFAVYGLAIGLLPGLHIDNAAHVGGLAMGFAVGYIAHTPRGKADPQEKVWNVLAWICGLVTVYAYVRWFLWFSGRTPL